MKRSWLTWLSQAGLTVMGIALLGLALGTWFSPTSSSQTYGVPAAPAAHPWVQATGLRDGILGLFTLYLAASPMLGRTIRSVIPFLGFMLLLPIGDVLIVLTSGGSWSMALPHLLGTVAILILIGICVGSEAQASD